MDMSNARQFTHLDSFCDFIGKDAAKDGSLICDVVTGRIEARNHAGEPLACWAPVYAEGFQLWRKAADAPDALAWMLVEARASDIALPHDDGDNTPAKRLATLIEADAIGPTEAIRRLRIGGGKGVISVSAPIWLGGGPYSFLVVVDPAGAPALRPFRLRELIDLAFDEAVALATQRTGLLAYFGSP